MCNEDYLIRGMAADGFIRAFAVTSKQTVQDAIDGHQCSHLVGIALGRALVANQMMSALLKDEDERMCLMFQGDGPIAKLVTVGQCDGSVKGYALHPEATAASVSEGIGAGQLTVVRELPHMDPMSSQVPLASGEIGDDIAYYYYMSEQIPTSIGVGISLDGNNQVKYAGGFLIQVMPGYDEELIDKLEANLTGVDSVTTMLRRGMTPEQILEFLLRGLEFRQLDSMPVCFRCDCNQDRAAQIVRTLGRDEIQQMIAEGEGAEVRCEYCGKYYFVDPDKLQELLD